MTRDETIRILREWGQCLNPTFSRIFVFGSLIQWGGKRFDPTKSDVDLVALFASDVYGGEARTVAGRQLREAKGDLELRMLRHLSRQDAGTPITSIVLLTPQELQWGVHKSGARDFFVVNDFMDVVSGEVRHIGNVDISSSMPSIEDAVDTLRMVQKYRNDFLSVSANGSCRLSGYDGNDPMPKEMMRTAAKLRCCCQRGDVNEEDRLDLNQGMLYLLQCLDRRIQDEILPRVGGRGEPNPISPMTLLLMWEQLADDAARWISKQMEVPPETAPGIEGDNDSR